jgi:hypothetical protein
LLNQTYWVFDKRCVPSAYAYFRPYWMNVYIFIFYMQNG